jgi:hypothetical protein
MGTTTLRHSCTAGSNPSADWPPTPTEMNPLPTENNLSPPPRYKPSRAISVTVSLIENTWAQAG